jgi:hypothetical protein
LAAFIHFSLKDDTITSDGFVSPQCVGFCEANWGPQDASVPTRSVSIHETKSVCGHVLMMGGAPIKWMTHKETCNCHSSCEAEIKATDECVKSVPQFLHLLEELTLLDSS